MEGGWQYTTLLSSLFFATFRANASMAGKEARWRGTKYLNVGCIGDGAKRRNLVQNLLKIKVAEADLISSLNL